MGTLANSDVAKCSIYTGSALFVKISKEKEKILFKNCNM